MIGIIDYGMGNLRSVQKAFESLGAQARIICEPEQVRSADKVVLPGVGAFADAIANLQSRDLVQPVLEFIDAGRPFLGICLGLQLLFDASEEDGEHAGLGVLPGRIVRFRPAPDDHAMKVPHMGWNTLTWNGRNGDNPLLRGLESGPAASVYFVHSYYAAPADASVIGTTTDYGGEFCSSVRRDNVFATQFHPEKSQQVGLRMLANFAGV